MSAPVVGVRPAHVLREIVVLWFVTLVLIRVAVDLVSLAGLPELLLAAVPILFMYMPEVACWLRGADSQDYPLALPARGDRVAWARALRLNAILIGGIAVPWIIAYHLWQTKVFGYQLEWIWPKSPLMLVGYHMFYVAIPEECFYRGYMQTRLDELWRPRWRILGADLGPGWILTCLLFAFGHSLVQFQWWHFAIFFPSLVFGWLRARTDGIIAGAIFHAWSNITVTVLDTLYGVVPP